MGVASTAPAYSLAATLGFVVVAIGLQAPIVTVLAFVPMLLISFGYKEMNNADPDCGTTFTWATRAFGPEDRMAGRMGASSPPTSWSWPAWPRSPGSTCSCCSTPTASARMPSSGWVLLVGILWIVAMTAICYVGIEISANFQKALLGIELTMLVVLSVVALVKVGNGTAPVGHLTPRWSWFNPFEISVGIGVHQRPAADAVHLLGLGHHGVGQRGDRRPGDGPGPGGRPLHARSAGHLRARRALRPSPTPGSGPRASGSGTRPIRTTCSHALGHSVFGTSGSGTSSFHLLLLMVLSSAAASTQTTILPTARTTLSMAVYKAIPSASPGSTSAS